MAKTVIIDELHVSVRIPANLPDDQAEAIRQTLTGDDFLARLRKAVREVIGAFPTLGAVRVSLTR